MMKSILKLSSFNIKRNYQINFVVKRSLFFFANNFCQQKNQKMLPIHRIPLKDFNNFNISNLSTSAQDKINETYKEFEKLGQNIEIPVPWGKLCAKEFGKRGGLPLIFLHGWLDNLNSWSLLIPHLLKLNENLHIIAFDEPGCGYSDSKPKGTYYESLGTLVELRRLIKHFNFNKVTLVGHSKGSFNCFVYAFIFPSNVRRIISFDLYGPDVSFKVDLNEVIDKRIEIDNLFVSNKDEQVFNKEYTEESALERFVKSRKIFLLNKSNGEILLKRGLKPYKNGVTFNRDIQWNFYSLQVYPEREKILENLNLIECDLQQFTATKTPFQVPDEFWEPYRQIYKKRCKVFEEHIVEGGHYIHMEKGEELAEKMNDFLNRSSNENFKNKL